MSTSTIAKASKVERAFERLEAAVDRLDVALSSRVDSPAGGTGDGEDSEALDRLRRENAELKDLNRTAAERLAVTIQRLDTLLNDETAS